MISTDIIIAIILIALVLLSLLLVKLGLLPKKSIPYVIGALAAIIGISLWRESRVKGLRKELEKREEQLKEREKLLAQLKDKYKASEGELLAATIELEKQKAAYQKALLQLRAKNQEELDRIDNLGGEDLLDEFANVFG